jgi:hypothetical protein
MSLMFYLYLQVMTYLVGVCLIGAGLMLGLTVGSEDKITPQTVEMNIQLRQIFISH